VNGNFNRKAYKISVLVITCPPDATPGVPYSYQMTAAGGVGPFKWQIDLGSLPPGLTMTDAGLITGTTTTVQAKYPITFSVADSGLVVACSKACTFYNQCPGANLLDTVFSAIKNSAGTCGCPACSANNNSMTFGVGVCPPPPGNLESCDYSYQSSAFTSATNFTLRITITITGTVTAFAQHTMPLYKSGVLQSDLEASLSYSPGTHTFDFPLTAGSYTIGKGGVNNARYSILFSGTGGSVTWSFNNKC
jgi:hypothetical protein